jgi:hypothetical protein
VAAFSLISVFRHWPSWQLSQCIGRPHGLDSRPAPRSSRSAGANDGPPAPRSRPRRRADCLRWLRVAVVRRLSPWRKISAFTTDRDVRSDRLRSSAQPLPSSRIKRDARAGPLAKDRAVEAFCGKVSLRRPASTKRVPRIKCAAHSHSAGRIRRCRGARVNEKTNAAQNLMPTWRWLAMPLHGKATPLGPSIADLEALSVTRKLRLQNRIARRHPRGRACLH